MRTHPDPALLYTLKPGLRGRVLGTVHAYNSRGIRDREFSPSPAPGTLRLLCVGDSIAYAQVTPLEDTFVKRIESSLRDGVSGWRDAEAINGGVAGYNACQEEAFFRAVGAAYHPHVVVWQYCLNDPDDAHDPLQAPTAGALPLPLSWNRALRDRFVLWSFLRVQWRGTQQRLGLMTRQWDASSLEYARRIYSLYELGEARRRDASWACLSRARDAIERQGGRMLVVIFPFAMQAAEDPEFNDAPQRDIENRCRQSGITCLDLLPTFRAAGAWDLYAKPDFVHLSDQGHRVAAAAIEKELRVLLAAWGLTGEATRGSSAPR